MWNPHMLNEGVRGIDMWIPHMHSTCFVFNSTLNYDPIQLLTQKEENHDTSVTARKN